MKKISLMFFAFILSLSVNAQVSDFQDFENIEFPNLPTGWSSSQTLHPWGMWPDVFSQVDYVCEGATAAGYFADPDNHPNAWLLSPVYTGAEETFLNVSFILSVKDNFTSQSPDFNWGTITFEYSADNGVTWTELDSYSENDELNCTVKFYEILSTDFSSTSQIQFKWTFEYIDENGQWSAQIDNFTINQDEIIVDPCDEYTAPNGETTQTIDEGQTLADLEVEGENLTWYADEELTEEVNPAETEPIDGDIFYVTQSNENCVSEPLMITITVLSSLNDVQMADLKVYPNPANDFINVSYTKNIESVTIIDFTGRKVMEKAIQAQEASLHINQLSTGTYLMNIQTTEGSTMIKFIKK